MTVPKNYCLRCWMVAILFERGSDDILQLIDGSYALLFNRVILS